MKNLLRRGGKNIESKKEKEKSPGGGRQRSYNQNFHLFRKIYYPNYSLNG